MSACGGVLAGEEYDRRVRVAVVLWLFAGGCLSKPTFGGDDVGPYPTAWNSFTNVQRIPNLSGPVGSDLSPTLSSNDYELFFTSERTAPPQLHRATRRDTTQFFSEPQLFAPEGNGHNDATITAAGTDLFFLDSSNNPGSLHRIDPQQGWTTGTASLPSMGPADVGAGDLRLMAGSTTDEHDQTSKLVEFSRPQLDGMWQVEPAPTFAPAPFGDTTPTLSQDGLELLYAHHSALYSSEIYRATRSSLAEPFTMSELVELSSGTDLEDPELSFDGRTLYFTSLNGAGHYEIWFATRTPM